MIKKIIAALFISTVFSIACYAQSPLISAECAALMCVQTGELLFEHNGHNQHSMASTTKIMSSLLACEYGCPEKVIKVSADMLKVEGTSMGLLDGDNITMKTLIYGMLLESGNDAANVTAYTIGGSPAEFAQLMNKRAKKIGMTNTNFVTPSGLDDENHYSTAYDMALLGCEAIKNVELRSICSQKSARVRYGNPPYLRTLSNHNRLLHSYEGCVGIKTGFTRKSRRCLVSAAERNGITLVAVTLNAPNDWNDHREMFDYGFSVLHSEQLETDLDNVKLKIVGGEYNNVSVRSANEPKVVINGNEKPNVVRKVLLKQFEYAPLKKDEIVGTIKYYEDDKLICEVSIITEQSVNAATIIDSEKKEKGANHKDSIIKKIRDLFKRS